MLSASAVAVVMLVYGLLVASGGVMGYVSAKSVASLVAGVASGLVLLMAAGLMWRGSFNAGWWIALVVTLALLARFVAASINDFKMMPGGMVILLSIIALIVLLIGRTAARV